MSSHSKSFGSDSESQKSIVLGVFHCKQWSSLAFWQIEERLLFEHY